MIILDILVRLMVTLPVLYYIFSGEMIRDLKDIFKD